MAISENPTIRKPDYDLIERLEWEMEIAGREIPTIRIVNGQEVRRNIVWARTEPATFHERRHKRSAHAPVLLAMDQLVQDAWHNYARAQLGLKLETEDALPRAIKVLDDCLRPHCTICDRYYTAEIGETCGCNAHTLETA